MHKVSLIRGLVAGTLLLAASQGMAETIQVNHTEEVSVAADGLCSFREAVGNANADSDLTEGDCAAGNGPDSIEFSADGTYQMNAAQINITDHLTINAIARHKVALLANTGHLSNIRGFNIVNFANVTFDSVEIVGGRGNYEGHRVHNAGTITLRDSVIRSTAVRWGVGFRVTGSVTNTLDADGQPVLTGVILERSVVRNNSNQNGGTVYFAAPGDFVMRDSSIHENRMNFNGGGRNGGLVVAGAAGDITIENSTISRNMDRREGGSGGLSYQATAGSLTVINSTISGNQSTGNAGGVYLNSTQAAGFSHVTISGNRADDGTSSGSNGDGVGGGLFVAAEHTGTIILDGVLIAGNVRGKTRVPDDVQLNGIALVTTHSLVDYTDDVDNAAFSIADLALGPLGNYGGPTSTHALGSKSIALDAAGTVDPGGSGFDQRGEGFARIAGSALDVGAYERHAPSLLHHWPFDDEPGNGLVDVVGGAIGAVGETGAYLDDGIEGGGLKLGRPAKVELGANDIPSLWTLSFWMRRDQQTDGSRFLNGPSGRISVENSKWNRTFAFYSPALSTHIFNYAPPLNQDVFITMVNRVSKTDLYANGELVSSVNVGFPLPLQYLGDGANGFIGLIDELRTYDGDLDDQQIADLYDASRPETPVETGFTCSVSTDSTESGAAGLQSAALSLGGAEQDITVFIGDAVNVTARLQTSNGTTNDLAVELLDEKTGYALCENGTDFDFTRVFVDAGEYPIRLRVTPATGSATEIVRTITVQDGGMALIDGLKGEHYQFTESRAPFPDFSQLNPAVSPQQMPVSTKENSYVRDENDPLYPRVYYAINSTGYNWNGSSQAGLFPDLYAHSNYAVRWSGKVRINATGEHEFKLANNDRARLYINNNLLIDHSTNGEGDFDFASSSAPVTLAAGMHDIRIELYDPADNGTPTTQITLSYREPGSSDFAIVPSDRLYHEISYPDADLKAMRDKAGNSGTILALRKYESDRLHPANEAQVRRDRAAALRSMFASTPFGGGAAGLLLPQVNAGGAGANFGYPLTRWEDYMRATNSPVSYDWFHAVLNDMHRYKSRKEPGLRPDGLWFQHAARGLQVHHDGYGIDGTKRFFGAAFQGTRWAYTEAQFRAKAHFVTTGDWFHYKGHTDRRVSGRWNFGNSIYPTRVAGIGDAVLARIKLDEPTEAALRATSDRLRQKPTAIPLTGNRFFYSGLLGVHRQEDWYIAAKLVNIDVAGPETFNNAYNKNTQYGIGHTEILRSGQDFSGNLKAVQNHSSLPGITYEYVKDIKFNGYHRYRGRYNTFAGGVSDGQIGTSSFQMNLVQSSVVLARKSYFYTPDGLVAMGAGVRTRSNSGANIYTTVNQVRWLSDIVYNLGADSAQQTVALGSGDTQSALTITEPAWFHHDGIGYVVVPLEDSVTVQMMAEQRTGSMGDVTSLAGGPLVDEQVFQLSIDHGVNPVDGTYLYYVLPGMSVADMPAYVDSLPVEVLQNDTTLQAVRDKRSGATYAAFHAAAELKDNNGSTLLTADKPVVTLLQDKGFKRTVLVADGEQYHNSDVILLGIGKPDGTVESLPVTPPLGFDGNRRGEQVTLEVDTRTEVSVVATDSGAAENPVDNGQFTITLAAPNNTGSPILVPVTFDGSALRNEHYTDPGTNVAIAAGEASAIIDIVPLNDDTASGDKSVTITLDSATMPAGFVAGAEASATLTISDNDLPPEGDADADGLTNQQEAALGTDPLVPDSDNDGVVDGVEDAAGSLATSAVDYPDADSDGVPDSVEEANGTDPDNASSFQDTDNGGVPDYVESVLFVHSGGQASDVNEPGDDNRDDDADGLPNALELELGADINDPDSPTPGGAGDTDEDGATDAQEAYLAGLSFPGVTANTDFDRDGYPDILEVAHLMNPLSATDTDSDKDGIPDRIEFGSGMGDIDNTTDTDSDGIPDAVELASGTPVNVPASVEDSDDDGVPDGVEAWLAERGGAVDTSTTTDTDSDGVADTVELASGSDAFSNNQPVVWVELSQAGLVREAGQENGIATAVAHVGNVQSGMVEYDWSLSDAALLSAVTGDNLSERLLFDPAQLTPGIYPLIVQVRRTIAGEATPYSVVSYPLRVVAGSAVIDTDGDGAADSQDAIDGASSARQHQLQTVDNKTSEFVLHTESGVKARLGATARSAQSSVPVVSIDNLKQYGSATNATDAAFEFPLGLYDFELANLPEVGATVRVVIPQSAAIPQGAVYRKYRADGGWKVFIENATDSVMSAAGSAGQCPAPGDSAYTAGLTAGHYCVQLTLSDAGANDADGQLNGAVSDPGGIGVLLETNQSTTTDGVTTDGTVTDGVTTDGTVTDGVTTDGTATDGVTTEGTATDGVTTDSAVTDGVTTDGTATDGVTTDGTATDGVTTDGTVTDGVTTDGTVTDGVTTDGTVTDGVTTDGTVTDGVANAGDLVSGEDGSDTAPSVDESSADVATQGPVVTGKSGVGAFDFWVLFTLLIQLLRCTRRSPQSRTNDGDRGIDILIRQKPLKSVPSS